MKPLRVFVAGQPVPKGSARAFVVRGRARITDAAGGPLKSWAAAVHGAAQDLMAGQLPLDGPVELSLEFTLRRPASHPKRARTWPTSKPDIDKLTRGVMDALTKVVYWDDAQVVTLYVTEAWAAVDVDRGPGVVITVERPPSFLAAES